MDPLDDYTRRQRGHQVADLRWHWGEAYKITWEAGQFRAVRRDNGRALSAAAFAVIHRLIRDDYTEMPVPRDAADW